MSITVTWQEASAAGVGQMIGWIDANEALFRTIFLLGMTSLLGYFVYQIGKNLSQIARAWLRKGVWRIKSFGRRAYHRFRDNAIVRSARGKLMSKWKKTVVSDLIYDAILTAEANRVVDQREARVIASKIAEALDLPELLPRSVYRLATRLYFLGLKDDKGNYIHAPKYEKLAGPRRAIPGGPPSLHIPPVENIVSHSEFINRMRAKKAA